MISPEILAKALGSTLLGMGTVFMVLIFISIIIAGFRFLEPLERAIADRKKHKKTEERAELPAKEETAMTAAAEEEDSEETAAIVAAALAAFLKGTEAAGDGYVVRRIRRCGN